MSKTLKLIILLTLIGLLLRMAFLSSRPPTLDEVYNFALVQAETKTMVKGGLSGFESPLYFLLLKPWLKMEPHWQSPWFLFQRSVGANIPYQKTNSSTGRTRGFLGTGINQGLVFSRFLSTLFGTAVILAIGLVGQKLFNSKVGIISSFLVAFSPVFIYESTNLKMYSLALLESLLIIYFFLKFLETKKTTHLIGLGLVLLLGLYTQFYFALVVLVLNLYFFTAIGLTPLAKGAKDTPWREKQGLLGKWLLLQIILFLLCLPLLWLLFTLPRPAFYPATNSLLKIPGVLVTFAVAWDAIQILKLLPFRVFTVLNIPLLLLTLGLLAAFLGGLKSKPPPRCPTLISNPEFGIQNRALLAVSDYQRGKKTTASSSSDGGRIFFLYIFFPIGLIFIISSLFQPLFSLRSSIIFSPAYYLTAALGIARLKKKRLFYSLSLFLLISSWFLAGQYLGFKATWTSTLPYNFVKQNSLPNDIFVHSDLLTFLSARFYLGENNQWAVTESWYPEKTEAAIGYNLLSSDKLPTKGNRLWYFFSETQYFNRGVAEEKQKEFEKNYPKILDKEFKDQDLKISLFDLTNR